MDYYLDKIRLSVVLGVLSFVCSSNTSFSQCQNNDCILLTGQYWVEITDSIEEFNIDCEYRWKVSNLNIPHGMMFYSTVTSHQSITVEWGGGIVLSVDYLDKSISSGNYHTNLTARTFERCPNNLP